MMNHFFGFREDPFKLTPDPRFFYANRMYRRARERLIAALRKHKGLAVLIGETGTGKTILLKTLIEELEPGPFHCVHIEYSSLTFEDFFAVTCHQLGLDGDGRDSRKQALERYLADLHHGRTNLVCLLDEAQNIPVDSLLALFEWHQDMLRRGRPLQLLLAGQSPLQDKLLQRCLKPYKALIGARCQLKSLNADEVEGYISHRLAVSGTQKLDLFTPAAITEISHHTQGVPRLINIVCNHSLLIAYNMPRITVSRDIVKEVVKEMSRDLPNLSKGPALPRFSSRASSSTPKSKKRDLVGLFVRTRKPRGAGEHFASRWRKRLSVWAAWLLAPPGRRAVITAVVLLLSIALIVPRPTPSSGDVSTPPAASSVGPDKPDNGSLAEERSSSGLLPPNDSAGGSLASIPEGGVDAGVRRKGGETVGSLPLTVARQAQGAVGQRTESSVKVSDVGGLPALSGTDPQLLSWAERPAAVAKQSGWSTKELYEAAGGTQEAEEVQALPAGMLETQLLEPEAPVHEEDVRDLPDDPLQATLVPVHMPPLGEDSTSQGLMMPVASHDGSGADASEQTAEGARSLAAESLSLPEAAEVRPEIHGLSSHAQLPDSGSRVGELLERAEQLFRLRLLTTPAGNNAMELYREVLRLSPDNSAAQDGIERIKDRYATWGQRAEKGERWQKAVEYYEKAQRIAPEDRALTAALERTRRAHQSRLRAASRSAAERDEASIELQRMRIPANAHALLEQSKRGDRRSVGLLLAAGVEPNVRPEEGWTPLGYAAIQGHIGVIRILLEYGANIDKGSVDGKTPLIAASWNGHRAAVNELLERGASIDATCNKGWTALMYAAWNGHIGVVAALLDQHARTDVHAQDGWTAYTAASKGGYAEIMALLRQRQDSRIQ